MIASEESKINSFYKLDEKTSEVLEFYGITTTEFIQRESSVAPTEVDLRDKDTPDNWIKRNKDLIRLTGRHPFNCEAPLSKLIDSGFITPTDLHYVRTHGATPRVNYDTHKIFIGGLAPNKISVSMYDLMNLPKHSFPVTLVCCGNRRKEQNMIKQTIGFNWGAAGVSTGVWTGVKLIDVLKLGGIIDINDFPTGLHIRFASESEKGGDKLPAGVYGTSVPLEKALDPSQDLLLAFLYNGKPLTPDHGYPVRLIVPGYIGGRMIKWITNIDLLQSESPDYYHYYDNRVLPPHVDSAEMAKEQDWWHKPEYICNELNINSAIALPADCEELQLDKEFGIYQMKGYAYTGGGRNITRVELSFDSGLTWKMCSIENKEKPNRYGKFWCWKIWTFEASHELLSQADEEVVLRAWDTGHNTQPDNLTWNLMGMLNNPWFRIKIEKLDNNKIRFEHPTNAGNQPGGWMSKPMKSIKSQTPSREMKTDDIVEEVDNSDEDHKSAQTFSMEEVSKHHTADSAWIVVNKKVYDCTPFLSKHPGGSDSILINAGTDCTEEFEAIHSKKAWKMLKDYFIGVVDTKSVVSSHSNNNDLSDQVNINESEIALNPKLRIPFTLIEKTILNHDSVRLRFALKHPKQILGLPVGQHMLFSAQVDNKMVMRAYTPISSDKDLGYFELVVKIYRSTTSGQQGGKMSQHLGAMAVGDSIDVKGPLGHIVYNNPGSLAVSGILHSVNHLSFLCAGSGITPIYQFLKCILSNDIDKTTITMIYANRLEEDILLREELDQMAEKHPKQFKLHYILSKPNKSWPFYSGRVEKELIEKLFPHSQESDKSLFALLCGPKGFIDEACIPSLRSIGYDDNQILEF